jgi:TRAP-type C4-dicarboxylate transport system substrate-binding protein
MTELNNLPLGHFFRLYRQISYISITEDIRRIRAAAATEDTMNSFRQSLWDVITDDEKRAMDEAIDDLKRRPR